MATSLLLLLDDIASVLDDVSAMTKVAAKKTAGVLGDDLALNAKQVTGVAADRELPVVWRVAVGSLINKLLLVPAALLLNWLLPAAVLPLLMAGGLYLCYEGAEKLLHQFLHNKATTPHTTNKHPTAEGSLESRERTRIRGAIRTDFILSAEIIVITLGIVASQPIFVQVGVLIAMSLLMTVGVYGLVAGIVKLDDLGVLLVQQPAKLAQGIGHSIVAAAPWLMRILTIAGTAAMFLVGGGILLHGFPSLHHAVEKAMHGLGDFAPLAMMGVNGLSGFFAGCLVFSVVQAGRTLLVWAGSISRIQ